MVISSQTALTGRVHLPLEAGLGVGDSSELGHVGARAQLALLFPLRMARPSPRALGHPNTVLCSFTIHRMHLDAFHWLSACSGVGHPDEFHEYV